MLCSNHSPALQETASTLPCLPSGQGLFHLLPVSSGQGLFHLLPLSSGQGLFLNLPVMHRDEVVAFTFVSCLWLGWEPLHSSWDPVIIEHCRHVFKVNVPPAGRGEGDRSRLRCTVSGGREWHCMAPSPVFVWQGEMLHGSHPGQWGRGGGAWHGQGMGCSAPRTQLSLNDISELPWETVGF